MKLCNEQLVLRMFIELTPILLAVKPTVYDILLKIPLISNSEDISQLLKTMPLDIV